MTENKKQVGGDPSHKLTRKLLRITQALEPIVKKGYNAFHKYKYATEFDVLTTLRAEFAKEDILILPTTEYTNYDPNSGLTTVRVRFTIINVSTDETMDLVFEGQGADKQDKGIYKAYTGCMKYFLLKTFQIPTTDDPENEGADTHANASKNAQEARSATKAPNMPVDALSVKVDRLRALAKEKKIPSEAKSALKQLIESGELTVGVADDYLKQYEMTPEKPPKKPKDDVPFN